MSKKARKILIFGSLLFVGLFYIYYLFQPNYIREDNIGGYSKDHLVFAIPRPYFFAIGISDVVIFNTEGRGLRSIGVISALEGDPTGNNVYEDVGKLSDRTYQRVQVNPESKVLKGELVVSMADKSWLIKETDVERKVVFGI